MPEPCGKVVHMHYFCGADIARDKLARRSKSGIKTLQTAIHVKAKMQ